MLQLKNTTPFAANMLLLADEQGIDSLYLTVKASFVIGPQWTLKEEQTPPQGPDVYWGEPETSSLKYASDYHLGKPATDIVMLGNACTVDQRKVRQMDVKLSVGSRSKTVRVFGDRIWQQGVMSDPQPFSVMPLIYEKAYGGSFEADGQVIVAEERNPVGTGFSGGRKARDMEGQLLPNLEDPANLIQSVDDCPEPACFGFRAPNWQPRAGFAGTYDQHWQESRAPYLPDDYNSRFCNAAHPDLIYPGYLQGGEPVEITNMHPEGKLKFTLPYLKLVARVEGPAEASANGFNLETLILEPNRLHAAMVWKAKIRCGKNALKIKHVSLGLSR